MKKRKKQGIKLEGSRVRWDDMRWRFSCISSTFEQKLVCTLYCVWPTRIV